jgi:hypothetical protein
MMKQFLINEDFANAVLTYLAMRPYKEVAHFVKGFQELEYFEKNNSEEKQSSFI